MNIGEKISLSKKEFDVVACKECSKPMLNIDRDEIGLGDLVKMKLNGLKVSNPDTDENLCIDCELEQKPSLRRKLSNWMKSDSNDDSGWHSSSSGSSDSGSSFGGGSFGGFGGGSFGGGGASGGF